MEYIIETNKTGVTDTCDVLVAGGGIAGIAAALSAARQGAKVILLEKQFLLGGLATAGLVTIYLPLCDGMGKQVSFGIAEELLRLSIRYGWEDKYPKPWRENGSSAEKAKTRFEVQYNPQLFAILAEQLLKQEGVKILYGTAVCAVEKECDLIKSVIVENKSGRSAIRLTSVVDATGDADVCHLAGEPCELFHQKNVLAAWYYYYSQKGYNLKMLGFADVPENEKNTAAYDKPLIPRRFQGVDGEELSEMAQLAHEVLLKDVLKNRAADSTYIPTAIAVIPQVRMTRRLCGAYTLSEADCKKHFPDSIGMIANWKKRGPVYEIPFRSLYGEIYANLITAGRCISAEESMWDISRVIPACAVTGEAAGIAASMSNCFRTLDIDALQKALTAQGVKLYL